MPWDPDLLDGYLSTDIPLPDAPLMPGEPEGLEVVATLVRRDEPRRSRRAVLYVHGWNDYFFQTHLADFWAGLGFDFYALDLRRYGRSLRRGQLHGFTTDLAAYDDELDAAADLIAAVHGAGVEGEAIRNVRLLERFALLEVPEGDAERVVEAVNAAGAVRLEAARS